MRSSTWPYRLERVTIKIRLVCNERLYWYINCFLPYGTLLHTLNVDLLEDFKRELSGILYTKLPAESYFQAQILQFSMSRKDFSDKGVQDDAIGKVWARAQFRNDIFNRKPSRLVFNALPSLSILLSFRRVQAWPSERIDGHRRVSNERYRMEKKGARYQRFFYPKSSMTWIRAFADIWCTSCSLRSYYPREL